MPEESLLRAETQMASQTHEILLALRIVLILAYVSLYLGGLELKRIFYMIAIMGKGP